MLHPDGWFPFLSVTNITKLERLHRAASRAIFCSLSFSPILFLSLRLLYLPVRVTLTYFAPCFYERTLRLPTSFPYFRFGQTWSETKTLQILPKSFCVYSSAHASFYFPYKGFPCLPFNTSLELLSFAVGSTLSSPCSRSDSSLSR